MSENVKIVPATCSQCGGTVEVDPNAAEAKCPFCGTTFVVEKAINNYNISHATIDHADNVNIDMTGSVKSVLDFFGTQMNEGRAMRREIRMAEAEKDKIVVQGFMKMFGIMCAVMMAFGMVMFVYYQVTDTGEFTESEYSESYENDSDYNITEGVIIDEQDT